MTPTEPAVQAETVLDAQEPAKPARAKAKATPAPKKPEKAQIVKGWCSKLDKAGNPCKMPALRGTDPMTCYNHTSAEVKEQMGHKPSAMPSGVKGKARLTFIEGEVKEVQLKVGKSKAQTLSLVYRDGILQLADAATS